MITRHTMHKLACILTGVLALGQMLHAAGEAVHEVKVGGQTLIIPSPQGFERTDGINPTQDEIAAQFIGAGNRFVIVFGTPESAAAMRRGEPAASPRNFNAQTLRSLEGRAFSPPQFESLRADAERDLERLARRLDAVLGKVVADASKSLSEKLKETVDVRIGDPVPLGTFERTRDSLGFSMMFKTQFAGKDTPGLSVVAAMIVRIRDRCLYLYATSDRNSGADEAWVKTEVLKWRDAIFAANGQADAPASSTASRVLQLFSFQRILTMAVAGAAIGLVVFLIRRLKHPRPPAS